MVRRTIRQEDGFYHADGKTFKVWEGSRAQVFNGTAHHTAGGLLRKDLLKNQWGRIVSAKKHATAKKERRLEKHGYCAEKGKFGFVRCKPTRTRRA